MGASYGLGFVDFTSEVDASKDEKIASLAAVAAVAGVPLRDAFDGIAVEVQPDGTHTELSGDLAASVLAAVDQSGGSASYSTFSHLDGYVVCIDGAEEGEVELPDGGDSYVGQLADFIDCLDRLLERDDVDEDKQSLHRTLRELCDRSIELGVPVHVGS